MIDNTNSYFNPPSNTQEKAVIATTLLGKITQLATRISTLVNYIGTARLEFKAALALVMQLKPIVYRYLKTEDGIKRDLATIQDNFEFMNRTAPMLDDRLQFFSKELESLHHSLQGIQKSLSEFNISKKVTFAQPGSFQKIADKYALLLDFQLKFCKEFDDYTKKLDDLGSAVEILNRNVKTLYEQISKLQQHRDRYVSCSNKMIDMGKALQDLDRGNLLSIEKSYKKLL